MVACLKTNLELRLAALSFRSESKWILDDSHIVAIDMWTYKVSFKDYYDIDSNIINI